MINITNIFIMLGNECNLQCKYCIQHDIAKDVTPHGVNEKIIKYIHNVRKQQKDPLQVTFYGGEPLIFWEDIKEYVKQLKRVRFNIITNGKLLSQEKVTFLNEHHFSVGLSYDGINSIQTRGYDVLQDKRDLVLQLHKLCLTGVITKCNYPEEWFNEVNTFNQEYMKLHHYEVQTNLDLLLNNNDLHGLSDFDLKKLNSQMQNLCDHYLSVQLDEQPVQISDLYIEKLLNDLLLPYTSNFSKCRNGINILNIDTNGNMYICHNTHIKIGDITDNYLDLLKRVFAIDKTEERFNVKCKDCTVYPLCKCGCMLSNEKTLNDYFCQLANAFYQPVIDLKEKFIN